MICLQILTNDLDNNDNNDNSHVLPLGNKDTYLSASGVHLAKQ